MRQHSQKIQYRHISISQSTNSDLIEQILQAKLDSNTIHVLTADQQSAGRGQHGKHWLSPVGNVYFSLYYPLNDNTPLTGLLSLSIGYQLSQLSVIKQINSHRQVNNQPLIGVKWINDLGYYQHSNDDKPSRFYKLAGVLIEPVHKNSKILGMVIGVGINVAHSPSLSNLSNAEQNNHSICLHQLSPLKITAKQLYQPIANKIIQAINNYQQMQDDKKVLQNFINNFQKVDLLYNRQIAFYSHSNDNQWLLTQSIGINETGGLQLRSDNGNLCSLFSGTAQFCVY